MVLMPLRDGSLSICIRAEQELFLRRIRPECRVATQGVKGISHQTLTVLNNLHVCGSRTDGRLLSSSGLEFSQCARVLDL